MEMVGARNIEGTGVFTRGHFVQEKHVSFNEVFKRAEGSSQDRY